MYVFALRQSCKGKALLFIPGITKRRIKVNCSVLFPLWFPATPQNNPSDRNTVATSSKLRDCPLRYFSKKTSNGGGRANLNIKAI